MYSYLLCIFVCELYPLQRQKLNDWEKKKQILIHDHETQLADHNSRWWFDSQRSENLTILFVLSRLNNISKSATNSFAKQIFLQLTDKYFLNERNIWLISNYSLFVLSKLETKCQSWVYTRHTCSKSYANKTQRGD